VIGVDMTPDMIEKARGNAEKGEYRNVEFRLGEIENLPAADHSVDAVLSNCVINLSRTKRRSFRRRTGSSSRAGGDDLGHRSYRELPEAVAGSLAAYADASRGPSGKRNTSVSWRRPGSGTSGSCRRAGPILRRARRQAP